MDLSFLLQGSKTNASSTSSVATPQAYGAKGDGVTDDT